MANDKLENLAKIGQLKPESASEEEIAGLLRSGAVRLTDAKNAELSKEFLYIEVDKFQKKFDQLKNKA